MPDARLYIEEDVEAGQALVRSRAIWQALGSNAPVSMYGATLRGDAWVLGAHQLASQALRPESQQHHTVLRRSSGGITLRAGDGITYVALGLRDRSALMPCPPARILNRNVRGALAGLRRAGVTARYFGRDFLSVTARPASFVGWASESDGRVLLELFVCERSSCWLPADALGYPCRHEDPLRGKEPVTLAEAGAKLTGRSLIEALAEGYRSGFEAEFQPAELPVLTGREGPLGAAGDGSAPPEPNHPADLDSGASELCWSHPREEAIGFVSAGVLLDDAGKLARVQVRGDYFADHGCALTLERMLIGVEPSAERVGRAVDAAYGPGGHDVEGVKNLRSFQAAILDAVANARSPRR